MLEGEVELVSADVRMRLMPGMCAGFRAGGPSHHLENRTASRAVFLEVGDRSPGDEVSYPANDLIGLLTPGGWVFHTKNGMPY